MEESSETMTTAAAKTTFFKVLSADGHSRNNNSTVYAWSLPTKGSAGEYVPGDWHEVAGEIRICQNGLHLTSDPKEWWGSDVRCYVAEYDGDILGTEADKIVVRRARLVRPASDADLSTVNIYRVGKHEIKSGVAFASGSATVRASGSATVRAYGSATVRAYDSATVEASDSATVEAYDSATVEASDSATVRAYGSATVRAYGSATVRAYGSATVTSTYYHNYTAVVTTGDASVHINRRGSVIGITVGGVEYAAVAARTEGEQN